MNRTYYILKYRGYKFLYCIWDEGELEEAISWCDYNGKWFKSSYTLDELLKSIKSYSSFQANSHEEALTIMNILES